MAEHITITTQALPAAPPTVTPYQVLVGEVIDALDQIVAIIPKLDDAEAAARRIVNSRLGVPEEFITTVVNAVEQSPELAAAKKLDPAEVRDLLQYAEAFRVLRDKLLTVTKLINLRLRAVYDLIVAQAQQMYRIAQQHASDRRSPVMAALVANMKRALGRKGLTKAQREERRLRMQEAAAEVQHEEVQKAA